MMWRDGSNITGRGGYIIGTELRYFYNVCIGEPKVLTDHWIILSELKGGGVHRNHKYCKGRTTWTIVVPKGDPIWMEDAVLNYIRKEVKKPTQAAQEKTKCIS